MANSNSNNSSVELPEPYISVNDNLQYKSNENVMESPNQKDQNAYIQKLYSGVYYPMRQKIDSPDTIGIPSNHRGFVSANSENSIGKLEKSECKKSKSKTMKSIEMRDFTKKSLGFHREESYPINNAMDSFKLVKFKVDLAEMNVGRPSPELFAQVGSFQELFQV